MDAGSIYVKIGAKLEPLDRAMKEVNTKLKRFEAKTAALAKKTEKLANTIIKRTALITAAIAGVSTAAVKVAGDFERAMVRVASVSQATGRQMGQLRKAALDLAGATEYTGRQVAEGMGFLAMAGFKVEQTIGAMPSVLQLATAGMMDLGTAADITTNILTGYGMEVDDLAKVNDILVSAMTGANVDLRMLGESFKYAGPVVKGAGIAFEEAAAAIALMGNAGIQGSMAGTSLRTAVSRLLNPSKQAQRILGRLGVQTKDATGKMRSLTAIITELERAGATTADMMALFGDRAGPAMAALVEQGSGALREFTARLRDSEGIAGKIERDMLNTWPGMWNVLKGQIEGVAITIGDDLLPYAKAVVTIAGDIVAKFQGLDKEQRQQILRWVGLAGAAVGVIAAFGLLVAGASLVMKGLAMLGGVLSILTSPWLIGGLLIAAIGTAIYTAWDQDWLGLRTTITGWADAVGDKFDALKTWWETSDFGQVVRKAWGELVEVWQSDELTLPQKVLASVSIIANAVADLVPSIREIWDVWKDSDLSLGQKVLKTVSIVTRDVGSLIESIMKWWTGTTLTLARKTAEMLGINPDTLWIIGFLERLNKIWIDEDLTLPQKAIKTVQLVVGEVVGLIESIITWWTGATLELAKKVVTLLGLDPETNALVRFLEELNAIWLNSDLTFGDKIIESIGLIPGLGTMTPFLRKVQEIWANEDLTLEDKVIDTVTLTIKTLEIVWDTFFQDVDEKIFKPIRQMIGTEITDEGKFVQEYLLAGDEKRGEMTRELHDALGDTMLTGPTSWWDRFLHWIGVAGEKTSDATDLMRKGIENVNDALDELGSRDKVHQFVDQIRPYAEYVSESTGLPWQYHAAHWGHETGWKIHDWYNLGGIKGGGTAGSVDKWTTEVIDGKEEIVKEAFAAFESLEEYVNAYIGVLKLTRYQAALGAKTAEEFGRELHRGGYATDDKDYGGKVADAYYSIMNRGYASGTPWTGHGPLDEVAGVVHRREAVIPWDALKQGPAGVLDFLGVPGFATGRGRGALGSLASIDPGLASDIEQQQTMLQQLTASFAKIPQMLMDGLLTMFDMLGTALMFVAEQLLGEEKAAEIRETLAEWKKRAQELIASFAQVTDEAEEVAEAIKEVAQVDIPVPELTRWQKFVAWLDEQMHQMNEAVEDMDWGKTIQTGLNTVSSKLREADSAFAQLMGELVSYIKVGLNDAGAIVIDWADALANMLNATIELALNSLMNLLFDDYGSQYRGLTSRGKETFPDLGGMLKDYRDWDNNLAELNELQRKIDRNTVAGGAAGAAVGFAVGGPAGAIIGAFIGAFGARKASQANYAADIEKLREKLEVTWQKIKETLGTTVTDMADSLAKAFSADTYEGFVADFAKSLEQQVQQALIMAFMSSETIRPLLEQLSDTVTEAVLLGTLDADKRQQIIDLYKDITDKSEAFYHALHDLGIATEDVADKMERVGESLRNIPSGFKIATRRFQSASPVPLAEGGIVTRPTLALVGESGPEAVIPLGSGGGGITVEVTVNGSIYADDFDDRVSRAVAKGARKAGLGRYGLAGGRA